jgi:hypothetical protein
MWHLVGLVRTDVLVECVTFFLRIERISELGTTLVTSKLNHTAKKHKKGEH